ncbi:MAG: peptidylprolyl isomerase [Candidatus Aenigmatarchaeota archaeon]
MEKGDIVLIEFVARLEDGEIFDLTSEEIAKKENIYNSRMTYGPVPIILGSELSLPGLEKALTEMKAGEEKDIIISPEDGFGTRNPKLMKIIPEKVFQRKRPMTGMIVDFSGVKGRIQSTLGGRIRVDFNHPLAGKKLLYHLKIVEHVTETKKKIESILKMFTITADELEVAENKAKITMLKINSIFEEKIRELIKTYANATTDFIWKEPQAHDNKG